MSTISDLFKLWDTITQMADAVDESHWAVAKWQQRGRIPSAAWPKVISAARRKGKKLSADDLLAMHESTRRSA